MTTHGIQIRTDYIMTRTDGETIPARDASTLEAAFELLAALEALQPILWNDGPLVAAYKDVEPIVEAAIAKARGANAEAL